MMLMFPLTKIILNAFDELYYIKLNNHGALQKVALTKEHFISKRTLVLPEEIESGRFVQTDETIKVERWLITDKIKYLYVKNSLTGEENNFIFNMFENCFQSIGVGRAANKIIRAGLKKDKTLELLQNAELVTLANYAQGFDVYANELPFAHASYIKTCDKVYVYNNGWIYIKPEDIFYVNRQSYWRYNTPTAESFLPVSNGATVKISRTCYNQKNPYTKDFYYKVCDNMLKEIPVNTGYTNSDIIKYEDIYVNAKGV